MIKLNFLTNINYRLSQGNYTYGHTISHCALFKRHNGDGAINLDVEIAPRVKVLSVFNKKLGHEHYVEDSVFEEALKREIRDRKLGKTAWNFPSFTTEELLEVYKPLTNKIDLDLFKRLKKNNKFFKHHKIYEVSWENVPRLNEKSDSFIGTSSACYIFSDSRHIVSRTRKI